MSSKTLRFENLLEAVPDALVGVDQKGLIRFVNRQTESLFGYDRDELVGQPIQMLVPEPLWQIYAQNRENYFADSRTRSSGLDLELSGLHHDGTEFPINISMSHIDTGDVLLVITAVGDVSRQQRAIRNAGITAAIVEYSDDAIIGTTLQGTITSWNPAAERMYGYSSGEILGKSLSLLIPRDREGEPTAVSARIDTGQHVEHLETTRVRKDGTLVPVSVTVAPILNEDGEVVGASAVHRDVTEQRQAYETAQRMAAIVENSDDAIIGSALDGTVTSWNPAAERMFGYSSQEIIGKFIDLLSGEDQRDEAKAFVVKIMSGQHVEHFATSRVRKNGSLFPASVTVSPIRDPDGAIVGASMICRDVTQMRQAFETAQTMAAIVESSEDAIIGSSLDRVITSWNVAAERMFGYASREIIGKSGSLLTHDENGDEIAKILAEIAAGQHFEHFTTTRYRKDGTAFPLSLAISPIRDVDGAVVGVSTICHDLTEQERAYETAQSMAAIVESSNDAIGGITLQGIITSWNPAAERLYGYSSQEMVGTSGEVITPKDRIGQFKAILTKVGAGQPVEHLETFRLHKDGTTFPVSLTISPIRDAGGAVLGASVISRDLTELQHAAQYARSLIEAALDPLVTISPDGKITDVNEATIKVTGVPREALVGSDFSHYFTDPDKAHQAYQQAFAQGSVTDYPLTLRHQGIGTLTDVVYNASVYRDTTGKVLGVLAAARDVSELKQAACYARSLIEAAPDPLAAISPDGKITDVNEATINITGVPRDKLIGSDFSGYFTDPYKAHLGYQRVFERGVVTDYPLTLRHRDGTVTDVRYNASLYRDANGNVLGVLAAARDITKQKEASEAAQRMAAIVEHSDDAIIGSTLEGLITSWNPAAERMYGYTRAKIVGRSIDLLSPKDRTSQIKATLAQIATGRPADNFETIGTRKDRTTFPVKLTIAPIRDAEGAVVGASAISRDVTEQRKALAGAQRLEAMVEFSGGALMSSTLDGIITSWNPAAEAMFGYSSDEILGQSDKLMTPHDRTGEVRAILAKFRTGQDIEQLETLRIRKDGTVFPVSLTIAPIRDTDGSNVGLSAIARDMTVRT